MAKKLLLASLIVLAFSLGKHYDAARPFSTIGAGLSKVYAQVPDVTPPTTSYVQTPASPDGKNGWYKSTVRFDLNATDLESGVKEINYRIDSGTWQKITFTDTQNLVSNPSFELLGATTSGAQDWEATLVDPEVAHSRDSTQAAPGYTAASAKIVATGGAWHGINNQAVYIPTTQFDNMTASVWLKTQDLTGSANFKIYEVIQPDPNDEETLAYIENSQSTTLTGTNNWTKVSHVFTPMQDDVIGIYIDIGLVGPGTVWVDAVNVNSAVSNTATTVTIGSDSENHRFEFYSVDHANNAEVYSCTGVKKNCIDFKLDQTPPGNWHNSGAFRGIFGSSHELYVYTNVEDATSGLSTFTDKYVYHTDVQPGFGRFSNLLSCNSTWLPDVWTILISPPFFPGVHSAYLLTPKTDFCNNDWKTCKTVKFYAEDLAGNNRTKDFCINGPWIRIRGEATVRSNAYIDMLSEPEGDNTDGLIEINQTNIDFFTSSRDWYARQTSNNIMPNYDSYYDMTSANKNTITELNTNSGVNLINSDFTIQNQTIPGNYGSATFNQINFINGKLRIDKDINIANNSTALFIVKGDVEVDKNVSLIDVAIITDGDFYTAYNANENESGALGLNGFYSANQFIFQRTLQGTNNEDFPSEDFVFEPKYIVQLKQFFSNSDTRWFLP